MAEIAAEVSIATDTEERAQETGLIPEDLRNKIISDLERVPMQAGIHGVLRSVASRALEQGLDVNALISALYEEPRIVEHLKREVCRVIQSSFGTPSVLPEMVHEMVIEFAVRELAQYFTTLQPRRSFFDQIQEMQRECPSDDPVFRRDFRALMSSSKFQELIASNFHGFIELMLTDFLREFMRDPEVRKDYFQRRMRECFGEGKIPLPRGQADGRLWMPILKDAVRFGVPMEEVLSYILPEVESQNPESVSHETRDQASDFLDPSKNLHPVLLRLKDHAELAGRFWGSDVLHRLREAGVTPPFLSVAKAILHAPNARPSIQEDFSSDELNEFFDSRDGTNLNKNFYWSEDGKPNLQAGKV